MIITCRRCSTKFRLDDSLVSPLAKTKCTFCGNIFMMADGMENSDFQTAIDVHGKNAPEEVMAEAESSKKAVEAGYKVLVVFQTPPDLNDVGFLIHARNFADRDLWAYFPEFKRIRRIPTTSQDDSFFGSDFSYDDFGGPPNLDDYTFTILREEVQDSRPCYVVEVEPTIHRKWTRYQAWVDKEQFVHRKIVYFQDQDPYRIGTFADVRVIDTLPTAFRMEMKNLKTSHRTEVVIEDILYHTSHPDDLFTQRSLERAGR